MPESSESSSPRLTPAQILERLLARIAELEEELARERASATDPRRLRELPPDALALAATGAAEDIIRAARTVAADLRLAAEADARRSRDVGEQTLTQAQFEAEGLKLTAQVEAEGLRQVALVEAQLAVQAATDQGERIVQEARDAADSVVLGAQAAIVESPVRLRMLGLGGLAALPIAYIVFALTTAGQYIDDMADLSRMSQARIVRMLDKQILEVIDLQVFAAAAVLVLIVAFARRQWLAGIVITVSYLAAIASAEVLKMVLPRPILAVEAEALMGAKAGLDTFPSGHATFVTALCLALIVLVPLRARATVAVVSSAVVLAVIGALVTAGWHRPSDVLAGIALAVAWLAPAAALVVTRNGYGVGTPRSMWVVPIVGVALAEVAVFGMIALMVDEGRQPMDSLPFLAATAVLIVAVVAVISVYAQALRAVDLGRRPV